MTIPSILLEINLCKCKVYVNIHYANDGDKKIHWKLQEKDR